MSQEQATNPSGPQQPERKKFKDFSPAEKKQFFIDKKAEKLVKAQADDTTVVNTKTLDASYFTQFINSMDYTMDKLRTRASTPGSKIRGSHIDDATDYLFGITCVINIFCAKNSSLANLPYRPPRGHLDLTKQINQPKALEQLAGFIELLSKEHDRIEVLIKQNEEIQKNQSSRAEDKPVRSVSKKAPATADIQSGIITAIEPEPAAAIAA